MFQVSSSRTFDVAAVDMWARVGDFHGLHSWHPNVTATKIGTEPNARIVTIVGGGEMVETLLDEGNFFYVYRVDTLGKRYESLKGTLRVQETGPGACVVEWVADGDVTTALTEEEATEMIRAFHKAGLDAL
jgi:hypothetical protein